MSVVALFGDGLGRPAKRVRFSGWSMVGVADREVERLEEGDESDSVMVAASVLQASEIEVAAALEDARST